ncbi:hypothetical protein BD310DRAFT_325492 [Dichomitus squalens]|uniref:Uncharacterized protein n=1 Tax=Dichomitus squalens TaxID=114155 RepID=A0A4Q9PCA6_9APHY|nr:hypothetical protein BD310DRAFT_325492 [Dichomitus squalens]
MQLMQGSSTTTSPPLRRWHAFLARLWRSVICFVSWNSVVELTDATTSSIPSHKTAGDPVRRAAQARGGSIAQTMASIPALRHPVSPRPKASIQRSKSRRASRGVSGARMHINEFDARSLISAIRRMDRKLGSQRVPRPLPQLVPGTKRQWSPASGRAAYVRHIRRKQASLLRDGKPVALLPARGSGAESDSNWSGEDTMCEP